MIFPEYHHIDKIYLFFLFSVKNSLTEYYENKINGQLFAPLAIIHSFSVREICKRIYGEISLFWLKAKKSSFIFVPIW